jgi:prephenate dehydratase
MIPNKPWSPSPRAGAIVAFQGRLGAYSENACLHLFGLGVELLPCDTFAQVFDAVESGRATHGVLPVENSTTGSIHENFDLMLQHTLPIVAEVKLLIEHTLMAPKGISLKDLKAVRSHPQALMQCAGFFREHPWIQAEADFDTAGSAERASKEGGPYGAIASALAAEGYGLEILRTNLEDQPGINQTRFFCFEGRNQSAWEGGTPNKMSVVFQPIENRAGVLFDALRVFAEESIDLVKIESRPLPGAPWQYRFYLDLMGHPEDPKVQRAMSELKKHSLMWRLLGAYCAGPTLSLFQSRHQD